MHTHTHKDRILKAPGMDEQSLTEPEQRRRTRESKQVAACAEIPVANRKSDWRLASGEKHNRTLRELLRSSETVKGFFGQNLVARSE